MDIAPAPAAPALHLANQLLALSVSPRGGAIRHFTAATRHGQVALMRATPDNMAEARGCACFPMVPFCNRVSGNRFVFAGSVHTLAPNMPWDPHYLHGDGWTETWQVDGHTDTRLLLRLSHAAQATPYRYDAVQAFVLEGDGLLLTLAVTNRGAIALPFGLGWHPFFPLTPRTTLRANATTCWDEGEGWLPTVERALPPALDFAQPRAVPRRWTNTGFEGWDGTADIVWPEHGLALRIDADPVFGRYLLFVSDPAYEPGYDYTVFCFEPMSHSADAHNGRGGGLVALAPGQTLRGSIRFTVRESAG